MKKPGTAHAITLTPVQDRVRIIYAGVTVADTADAIELREGSLPPVYYIPRQDADAATLEPTDHRSHCPFKGDAVYFTLSAGGKTTMNAAWSYEEPYPAAAGIKRYLAYYPDKVEAIKGGSVEIDAEQDRD